MARRQVRLDRRVTARAQASAGAPEQLQAFDADAAQAAADAAGDRAHWYSPAANVALIEWMYDIGLSGDDIAQALHELALTGANPDRGWHDRTDAWFAQRRGIGRQRMNYRRQRLRHHGVTATSQRQRRGRAHRTVVGPVALLVLEAANDRRGVPPSATPGVPLSATPLVGDRSRRKSPTGPKQPALPLPPTPTAAPKRRFDRSDFTPSEVDCPRCGLDKVLRNVITSELNPLCSKCYRTVKASGEGVDAWRRGNRPAQPDPDLNDAITETAHGRVLDPFAAERKTLT